MGLAPYLKEVGRGREGARSLSRAEAADLMGLVLDSQASDLEIGAFCIAMRVKGETSEELAGFCDAFHRRIAPFRATNETTTVVLPSYNGARKLPLLTPLLALLLAREGFAVLVHGSSTEERRVGVDQVFPLLGVPQCASGAALEAGKVYYAPSQLLHPGLRRLLQVRRILGLRNSAHSVAKLLLPCEGKAVLISSYTHPEYLLSMTQTLQLMGISALLLRGTEGEAVADVRRTPTMHRVGVHGVQDLGTKQEGVVSVAPDLPMGTDAQTAADYTRRVLAGSLPVPVALQTQVRMVVETAREQSAV